MRKNFKKHSQKLAGPANSHVAFESIKLNARFSIEYFKSIIPIKNGCQIHRNFTKTSQKLVRLTNSYIAFESIKLKAPQWVFCNWILLVMCPSQKWLPNAQKLHKTFPETGETNKFSHITELKVPHSSFSTQKNSNYCLFYCIRFCSFHNK